MLTASQTYTVPYFFYIFLVFDESRPEQYSTTKSCCFISSYVERSLCHFLRRYLFVALNPFRKHICVRFILLLKKFVLSYCEI